MMCRMVAGVHSSFLKKLKVIVHPKIHTLMSFKICLLDCSEKQKTIVF